MPPRVLEGVERAGPVVRTAEEGERAIVEGLDAEGKAPDAGRAVVGEAPRVVRVRIGFEGDLDIGRDRPQHRHAVEDGDDRRWGHEGGRPATEIDAPNLPPLCPAGEMVELC